MIFNEKSVVGPQRSFSPTDLMEYVESLLKEARLREEASTVHSNYSWLRSRSLEYTHHDTELEKFKPIVEKLSSENCAKVAVKLDVSTHDDSTSADILTAFKKVLEEQQNQQLIEGRVKRAKESNNRKRKNNRVHPELLPPGRQPTVSFILEIN